MNAIEILEAWNASIRQKSEYPLGYFLIGIGYVGLGVSVYGHWIEVFL